jgi:hypothetical protein
MAPDQAHLLNSPRRFIMARRCARLPVNGPETEFSSPGAATGAGDTACLSASRGVAAAAGVSGSVFSGVARVSL